jgi:hypothetical protein
MENRNRKIANPNSTRESAAARPSSLVQMSRSSNLTAQLPAPQASTIWSAAARRRFADSSQGQIGASEAPRHVGAVSRASNESDMLTKAEALNQNVKPLCHFVFSIF